MLWTDNSNILMYIISKTWLAYNEMINAIKIQKSMIYLNKIFSPKVCNNTVFLVTHIIYI